MKYDKLNDLYLRLCAKFLNGDTTIINKQKIESLGNLPPKENFCYLLAAYMGLDIEKYPEHKEFFSNYILESVNELETEKYCGNEYLKKIKFKNIKYGEWSLETQKYSPYESFVCNATKYFPDGRRIPQIGYFKTHFYYPAALQNERIWMTVTPNEIETMKTAVQAAKGKVLAYGLGLGYYAFSAHIKSEVVSVTVVERDSVIINLFKENILPYFPYPEKIEIVNSDAFEFAENIPENYYDVIFTDIWRDVSDGKELYLKMKTYEKKSPLSEYHYWIEDEIKYYL